MKTSLLFLIISSIPMIDILISFKTNQYAKTLPKTKIGRSLFAFISTAVNAIVWAVKEIVAKNATVNNNFFFLICF